MNLTENQLDELEPIAKSICESVQGMPDKATLVYSSTICEDDEESESEEEIIFGFSYSYEDENGEAYGVDLHLDEEKEGPFFLVWDNDDAEPVLFYGSIELEENGTYDWLEQPNKREA